MTDTYRGQLLRGRSFVDADLAGKDFGGADLRAANFSGADLTAANFANAKLGLQPALTATLFVASLAVVAGAGWLTGWSLKDIVDELRSSEWENVFGGSLAALVIVVFLGAAIVRGLRYALLAASLVFGAALALNYTVLAIGSGDFDLVRDARVIALLALLGASMIAGGLARVLGGTLSPIAIVVVALTGGIAAGQAGGGVAGLAVSMLLVALAKRTLERDPRDQWAYELIQRLVAYRSARFVRANLADADFSGTEIMHCDTTGANLSGTKWDGGIGPWSDPKEESHSG